MKVSFLLCGLLALAGCSKSVPEPVDKIVPPSAVEKAVEKAVASSLHCLESRAAGEECVNSTVDVPDEDDDDEGE